MSEVARKDRKAPSPLDYENHLYESRHDPAFFKRYMNTELGKQYGTSVGKEMIDGVRTNPNNNKVVYRQVDYHQPHTDAILPPGDRENKRFETARDTQEAESRSFMRRNSRGELQRNQGSWARVSVNPNTSLEYNAQSRQLEAIQRSNDEALQARPRVDIFHEGRHAYDTVTGSRLPGVIHSSSKGQTKTYPAEEMRAVGRKPYENERLTEVNFGNETQQPIRPRYDVPLGPLPNNDYREYDSEHELY